ncbi:MAG: hypothetical protein JNL98_09660 [Bryobacterales bacterium]|nr:hypothetical protein [Bryobacterales bacterium]
MRLLFLVLICGTQFLGAAEGDVRKLLQESLKLSPAEIRDVERGLPIVREEPTQDKNEVLMYGVVFVNAPPEHFLKMYADVEKLVDGKSYLAAKYFRKPPTMADLASLAFDAEDIDELRNCVPGDCNIQMPADEIKRIRSAVNWNAADAARQANQVAREVALKLLLGYQKAGNQALGTYHDKETPANVTQAFQRVLSRAKDLPSYYPRFTEFLLRYPAAKPPNTWDFFHWEVVKFGLKPTFRMNHVVFHQPPERPSAWVAVSKQLYASHYFQTALDLWFCVPGSRVGKSGYYLATLKGSRQEGLTGFKGRLLRGVVISRTQSSMRNALARLKERSETGK